MSCLSIFPKSLLSALIWCIDVAGVTWVRASRCRLSKVKHYLGKQRGLGTLRSSAPRNADFCLKKSLPMSHTLPWSCRNFLTKLDPCSSLELCWCGPQCRRRETINGREHWVWEHQLTAQQCNPSDDRKSIEWLWFGNWIVDRPGPTVATKFPQLKMLSDANSSWVYRYK